MERSLLDFVGCHKVRPTHLLQLAGNKPISMQKDLFIANNFYASFQPVQKECFSESGVNKIMNKIKCTKLVIISFL